MVLGRCSISHRQGPVCVPLHVYRHAHLHHHLHLRQPLYVSGCYSFHSQPLYLAQQTDPISY